MAWEDDVLSFFGDDSGAFDTSGLSSMDKAAFDFDIDPSTLGSIFNSDINLAAFDFGIDPSTLGGISFDDVYAGLNYSPKDIEQLFAGTYAGGEQGADQVISQLGRDLYNELYPMGIENLSSSSYEGLGYTANEIADLMAGQEGIRDTNWSGVIKTDSQGNITQIGNTKFGGGAGGGGGGDIKKIIDTITKGIGNKDNAALIAMLGGLLGLLGKGSAPKAPIGYQGGIPKYKSIRGEAMSPTAGGRRPGGANIPSLTGGYTLTKAAGGGLMDLAQGGRPARYLRGGTDGMADEIKTDIDGKQPARLSHGEFVIPADVVSHLGNGNSDAGADVLYDMMAKVRKARTGTTKQGKQINPRKMIPA